MALVAQQIFPDDRRQQRDYCNNRLDVLLHYTPPLPGNPQWIAAVVDNIAKLTAGM
jgi:hypothetical protein